MHFFNNFNAIYELMQLISNYYSLPGALQSRSREDIFSSLKFILGAILFSFMNSTSLALNQNRECILLSEPEAMVI